MPAKPRGPTRWGGAFAPYEHFAAGKTSAKAEFTSAEHFKRTQVSKQKDTLKSVSFFLEATPGFEPGNQGFADPCLTTWLCRHVRGQSIFPSPISICTPAARYYPGARPAAVACKKIREPIFAPIKNGAGDGARTRYLHLGKVALYQMSYARMMRSR